MYFFPCVFYLLPASSTLKSKLQEDGDFYLFGWLLYAQASTGPGVLHVDDAVGDADPRRVENGRTHRVGKGDYEAKFRVLMMLHFIILLYFYHDFPPPPPIL